MIARPERDRPGAMRGRSAGLRISGAILAVARRLYHNRDVAVCALIATIVGCVALQRMGYLAPAHPEDILAIDSARTAYVARNIAEGKGYTANELPASLVAYYDRIGRLHDEHWPNADRFPFAAYAIALLYTVTGRRHAWTGIVGYNLITFVAFLAALYVFTRRVTSSRAGGTIAVALALLHSRTYVFVWMKDADMMLLAVLTLSCFHTYFAKPLTARSASHMTWFGTVLAWFFLSRPNVGAPFIVALGLFSLVELTRGIRALGAARALRCWLGSDAVAGLVTTLWILPYLVHTLREWGTPFFSANALYQPILGTRFGMGTDTWWRYLPPNFDYSVAHLWREARAEVIAKYTTSWSATLRSFVTLYFVEIALAFSAVGLHRAAAHDAPAPEGHSRYPLRGTAIVVLACFAFNFATLPLYSYRDYAWIHYLSFVLPLMWVAAASTLLHIGTSLGWARTSRYASRLAPIVISILVGGLFFLSLNTPGNDGNMLAMAVVDFWQRRPQLAPLGLLSLLTIPLWWRWSSTTRLLVLSTIALILLYRPYLSHKRFAFVHVPASQRVWTELRQRRGTVASFTLQSMVPWSTGRRSVMAPELVMNLYEMNRAHRLEFEDIYIESPEAALQPTEGFFGRAAPGFEGYQRIVQYRDHLPGYRLSFHEQTRAGDPRYGIPERPKSSTTYTLVDRSAVARLFRTPRVITIGDESSVVHTAHGFGGYYRIDGKPTVAATDATRRRYGLVADKPWEDTSMTFFVDAAAPSRVTIQLYAVAPNVFTFYWNLDLDEYTRPAERAGHQLGEVVVTAPGWRTVSFDVPRALVRRGLNKLGFRAERFILAAVCALATPDPLCPATAEGSRASILIRADTTEPDQVVNLSLFLHRIDFDLVP